MRRIVMLLLAAILLLVLSACGGGREAVPGAETASPTERIEQTRVPETPAPTKPPSPMVLTLPEPAEGWAEAYIGFIDEYPQITPSGLAPQAPFLFDR